MKKYVFIIAILFLAMQGGSRAFQELAPTPRSSTDDEQEMPFYLGPLVLKIKNKNLIFPFSKGEHPFDARVCSTDKLRPSDYELCVDGPRSVFLEFSLPIIDGQAPVDVVVTLGYKQNYNIFNGTADEFIAVKYPYEGARVREHRLDTRKYSVARILPYSNLIPQNFGTTYFFIAKEKQSPRVISCNFKPDQDAISSDTQCGARTWILTQEFPEKEAEKYAFSLDYSFPAERLDQAPLIEQATVGAVAKLPRTRIQWPPTRP